MVKIFQNNRILMQNWLKSSKILLKFRKKTKIRYDLMLKVQILNNFYSIPANLLSFSIDLGKKIDKTRENWEKNHNISKKDNNNQFETDLNREILRQLIGCSEQEIDNVEDNQVNFLVKNLNYINNSILLNLPNQIKIKTNDKNNIIKSKFNKNKVYNHIDFKDLLVSDYLEIENLIQNQVIDNIDKITSVLYSRIPSLPIEYNNYIFCKSCLFQYLEQRKYWLQAYELIPSEEELNNSELLAMNDKIDENIMNDVNKNLNSSGEDEDIVFVRTSYVENVAEKYGVYYTLQVLCNGDINQILTWLNQNVLDLFYQLRYRLDVQREEMMKSK